MRRTHQRQLGARRCARVGAEPSRARTLIAELVWAHEESIALVRTLLPTHEHADPTGASAANPADRWADDRVIDAAALAAAAQLAKLEAADKWASHVMRLHGLIAMTGELFCNPVPGPGREEPPAAAATARARFRSRGDGGDCLGRPG